MKRALLLALALMAVSPRAEAHSVGFKSPSPGMHFTEGQPLVVYANLLDDREWKGLIVCPAGQTVSNREPPPDYSAPRAAQCSGGGTPTGWPQLKVLIDGIEQTDTITGSTTVTNTTSFDHNGNDSPIDLFPFSAKGISAGSHQVVIRGLFSADGVKIDTVDSPPLTVVVDAQPSKTVLQLDDTNGKGAITWNNVIVVGNGKAVSASGNVVIKNSMITGVSGFTGSVTGADIENSIFEDTGLMKLTVGTGSVTINNNEWRANNRLTFVPSDPSVPFIVNFTGSGGNQKLFQGNRVGGGQVGFGGQNWLIGGDTDAAGNVFIGQRTILNVTASNTVVRGNYSHHVYAPGMWSQGHNFDFTGAGSGALIEHNLIRDSSWPLQNLVGEFRYNVVFGYGHTWLRTATSGTSIHHNLFVPGDGDEVYEGFQCYLGETGLTIYNNTFDGGGAEMGRFAGPMVHMVGGSQVLSLRNNLVTFTSNMANDSPGVTPIQGGATAYLYADYNAFYSPDNTTKINYDFDGAGAHDVSGTGAVGVVNGQLAANPFAGKRVTVDKSKVIEGAIEGVIDEAAIWQGTQGISRVLAIFRERYTPKTGSPIIDTGDPKDTDTKGRKADIGAIDLDGHDQDKLGKFGTPPSEVVPPTVTLTAPMANAVVTGTATVSATASDNTGGSGVTLVQFLVDGGTVAQATTSPYTATFNSVGFASGQHAFSARAWDAAGNSAVSALVTAQIMNAATGAGGTSGSGGAGGTGGSGGNSGRDAAISSGGTSGSGGASSSGGNGARDGGVDSVGGRDGAGVGDDTSGRNGDATGVGGAGGSSYGGGGNGGGNSGAGGDSSGGAGGNGGGAGGKSGNGCSCTMNPVAGVPPTTVVLLLTVIGLVFRRRSQSVAPQAARNRR